MDWSDKAISHGSLFLMMGEVSAPVTALEISESPNEHSMAAVTIMTEEEVKEYILYQGEGNVSLLYLQGESVNSLFQGSIMRMEVMAKADIYYISLKVTTGSFFIDIEKYNLSFQDTAMTSHQLIQQVMSIYPGSKMLLSITDLPLGRIAVQYQETTWEFLKRILSEYEACLYVDSSKAGIHLKMGLTEAEEQVNWDHLTHRVMRNVGPKGAEKQLKEQISYQLEAYDVLPLGTQVKFHNQMLYIGDVYRYLKEGILVNRYQLHFKEGLKNRKYHNPLLGGVSINGVVTNIQRNQVQVQMETDTLSNYQNQYFFPFSTVAASADGSGWYCMPKVGDQVRIFFPVSDEKEGYAIANIQGESAPSSSSAPMGNPDIKDITAPDGKTVTFTENGILLSVGENGAITLTNDGKAEIKSEEGIVIGAAKDVYVTTDGELKVTAGVKIQISSDDGGSITITEDTVEANAAIIASN